METVATGEHVDELQKVYYFTAIHRPEKEFFLLYLVVLLMFGIVDLVFSFPELTALSLPQIPPPVDVFVAADSDSWEALPFRMLPPVELPLEEVTLDVEEVPTFWL